MNKYKTLGPLRSLSCIIWIQESVVRSDVGQTTCGTRSVVDFCISYVKHLVVLLRVYRLVMKICTLE